MRKADRVTLVKKDGSEFPDIHADVQPKMIFIDDPKLPVEEGDHFAHTPPNGILASYLVLNAHYWGKPGGWQIEVRKETAISRNPPGHQIHQHGANPRAYINSQDFSTNIINEANVFEQARKAIESRVGQESERKEILNRLEALEKAKGKAAYVVRYREFISAAADHMTVLAPYIPALSQLLAGK
jgi:hypothetical protein